MFSNRKCANENCNDYAVTGSKFCFSHIDDSREFMLETISKLNDCDNITNFKLCRAELSDIKVPCREVITSKFSGTDFRNVIFDDVSIKLCFYDFCTFDNCSFNSVDIRYSVFAGSVFNNCSFMDSEVMHTNFNGVKMHGSNFQSCDLYYSSFVEADLKDTGFKDCNLKKVYYLGSTRSNVSFQYSNVEEAEFDKGDRP